MIAEKENNKEVLEKSDLNSLQSESGEGKKSRKNNGAT